MKTAAETRTHPSRLSRHRAKAAAGGQKRVEVTVPAGDVALVKSIADALRAGGEGATRIRDSVRPLVAGGLATTGAELVAFLRSSPFVGIDLEFPPDTSSGRSAEFE